jgi:hypothetical protein
LTSKQFSEEKSEKRNEDKDGNNNENFEEFGAFDE